MKVPIIDPINTPVLSQFGLSNMFDTYSLGPLYWAKPTIEEMMAMLNIVVNLPGFVTIEKMFIIANKSMSKAIPKKIIAYMKLDSAGKTYRALPT